MSSSRSVLRADGVFLGRGDSVLRCVQRILGGVQVDIELLAVSAGEFFGQLIQRGFWMPRPQLSLRFVQCGDSLGVRLRPLDQDIQPAAVHVVLGRHPVEGLLERQPLLAQLSGALHGLGLILAVHLSGLLVRLGSLVVGLGLVEPGGKLLGLDRRSQTGRQGRCSGVPLLRRTGILGPLTFQRPASSRRRVPASDSNPARSRQPGTPRPVVARPHPSRRAMSSASPPSAA